VITTAVVITTESDGEVEEEREDRRSMETRIIMDLDSRVDTAAEHSKTMARREEASREDTAEIDRMNTVHRITTEVESVATKEASIDTKREDMEDSSSREVMEVEEMCLKAETTGEVEATEVEMTMT